MIVVIIPVFNEEKNIEKVIASVSEYCDKLIVVNDCSTDNTKHILSSLNQSKLIIIDNDKNLGIGGATKVGLKKALEIKAEFIVKFDGDGQHLAQDIPKFLDRLKNDNLDFIKGNRFKSSISEMPFYKLIGNLLSTNLQKIVTGNFSISDPNNGFLAFRSHIFKKIKFKHLRDDYFFENSLLLNLNVFDYKISEEPIETIYAEEKSSIPMLRGSLKLFPVFVSFLYTKNNLDMKVNLSMGSIVFYLINFFLILKIFYFDLISPYLIIGFIFLYLLIDIINFFND